MSTKAYEEHKKKELRLVLLRLLSEENGKQANSSRLHAGLQFLRIYVERHEVIEALRFLQTHQLVELEQLSEFSGELYGAQLRSRGMDVVHGRLTVDGVLDVTR